MKALKRGPLGAVGTVRSFMNVVKDIDFDEVRDRAEDRPRVLVIGADGSLARDAVTQLFGDGDHAGVEARAFEDGQSIDSGRWDVIIVYDPSGEGLLDNVRKATRSRNAANVFFLAKPGAGQIDSAEQLRAAVTESIPDLAPALGRHHEAWRKAAVRAIIAETSQANAKFALVSNVPSVVPFLGGFVAASADLIVLTKNQLMMAYKIAAAHGRNLDDHLAIIRELTPVAGSGFVWRTLAREATSFIPFAAGTIPKVAIAYVGTMTLGRAADYYYNHGSKPSRDQLDQFKQQAIELAGKVSLPGLGRSRNDANDATAPLPSGTPAQDASSTPDRPTEPTT